MYVFTIISNVEEIRVLYTTLQNHPLWCMVPYNKGGRMYDYPYLESWKSGSEFSRN